MPAKKPNPARLKAARKAETVARVKYDKSKKKATACVKHARKDEVALASKQLARIRIQYPN